MRKCRILGILLLIHLFLGQTLVACSAPAESIDPPAHPAEALQLPAGFKATVFARFGENSSAESRHVRMMTIGPDQQLYVSLGAQNKVVMLPDLNHDGVADNIVTVVEGLNDPQGLAFVGQTLYVANQDSVVRVERKGAQWPATGITPIIKNLPTGGHAAKSLKLSPDGYFFINVGSSCNVCDETDPMRATLLRYTTEGQPAGALLTLGRHAQSAIWASGLRNTQGFAWHPVTGELFATNEGADNRSASKNGPVDDDLPPEHLNRIQGGQHYGWPYCWGKSNTTQGQVADPNVAGSEDFCKHTQPSAINLPAHGTPIGITFLKGSQFPPEYQGDAIIALHGSWNRKHPSGYALVRVKFNGNQPVEVYPFASGWLKGNQAWGRPVDVIVGADGALYVSDDRAGLIYRITYTYREATGS